MARGTTEHKTAQLADILRIRSLTEPEIQSYVSSLRARFQKYRMPLEEGRKVIDKAMGATTLTEVLYDTREREMV